MEKPDKEQIDPEEDDESAKDDKSPKRTRSHSRESLKDKRKSRRSRSRSRSPRKKREKSAGEESASEGEINWIMVAQSWIDYMCSWVNLVVHGDYEYQSQVFSHLQGETLIRGARRIPYKPNCIVTSPVSRKSSIFARLIPTSTPPPPPLPREVLHRWRFSGARNNQSGTQHSFSKRLQNPVTWIIERVRWNQ